MKIYSELSKMLQEMQNELHIIVSKYNAEQDKAKKQALKIKAQKLDACIVSMNETIDKAEEYQFSK
jgi:cob(I)alamin adenosyltransferase